MTDTLELIASEGVALLDLGRRDPEATVPQYPHWTLRDLIAHTAAIHARTTIICEQQARDVVRAPHLPHRVDPFIWYETGLNRMLTVLETADPKQPVWGFGPTPTVGFWVRRMLIETGVHRRDAEEALGPAGALLDAIAQAGLEEYPDMWLPRLSEVPPLEVAATDLGLSWRYGEGDPVARVEGKASELYLRLMSRPSSVVLPEAWAAAVDALAQPGR